jgi:hypothetical protein
VLLQRNTGAWKSLGVFVLLAGLAFAAVFAVVPWVVELMGDRNKAVATKVTAVLAAAALTVGIAGSGAYALQTASVPHSGSIPSAGPTTSGGTGIGGGGGRGGGTRTGGGTNTFGGGAQTGTQPGGTGTGTTRTQGGFGGGGTGGTGGGGGAGGLLDTSTASAALVAALKTNASSYTWVLATVGANNAAGYQLSAQEPVMAIGGFNGSDPTPTLAAFEALVKAGKVHYFIGGSSLGAGQGATGTATAITAWVEANYTATTIGGTTVYDLSGTTSSTATTT